MKRVKDASRLRQLKHAPDQTGVRGRLGQGKKRVKGIFPRHEDAEVNFLSRGGGDKGYDGLTSRKTILTLLVI